MKTAAIIIASVALLSSCATLPKQFQTKDEVITTGPGTEDIAVDTISEQPRLLISCAQRRMEEKHYAEINVYYPSTGTVKIIERHQPADIDFNPHGLDLVMAKGVLTLLVVNHDLVKHENAILRYRVYKDSLVYLGKVVDPLITSPNAVTGFTDGTMLISNDAKKQGNSMEALFILKRAQIIYWDGNKCSVASGKYCYSNGITNNGSKVYLASTRQNKIWQFDFKDGKMINRQVIAKVHGPDNLKMDGDEILTACHLRFLAFLKHMKNAASLSPTTAYRINPANGTVRVVYYDSGAQISAGSTAIAYKGFLYLGDVFDAKIVKAKGVANP